MTPEGLPRTASAKDFERRFVLFLPVLAVVAIMSAFRMRNVVETFPNMAAIATFSNFLDMWFSEPPTRGQVFFFGRPLGRVVVSRPSRTALLLVQLSSPKGKPRFTLWRSEFSSASVSTLFTHERQVLGNGGSSGIASQRRSSARWRRADAELYCQSSASSMKFARTGFRSTYRMTVSKWPSV